MAVLVSNNLSDGDAIILFYYYTYIKWVHGDAWE